MLTLQENYRTVSEILSACGGAEKHASNTYPSAKFHRAFTEIVNTRVISNSRGGQHSNRVHIQVCGELGQNEVEPGDTLRPQATLQDGEYALSQNPEREARISQVGHYLHNHIADHD